MQILVAMEAPLFIRWTIGVLAFLVVAWHIVHHLLTVCDFRLERAAIVPAPPATREPFSRGL